MNERRRAARQLTIWPSADPREIALRALSEGRTRETAYRATCHGEAISWVCQGPIVARWQSCPFRGLCETRPACLERLRRALVVWRARTALGPTRIMRAPV